MSEPQPIHAKWIWSSESDVRGYNQTIIARRTFELETVKRAVMRITADSAYRLLINDRWVNDGPCRSWPEHYQYDEIDVTGYLQRGENTIRVIAKYWGTGTFHTVPQQAGLLAELTITSENSEPRTLPTDERWEVAVAREWRENTPKVSIQMEPQEDYDARREQTLEFGPAQVLFEADEGPWQDLHPRDVRLLTKEPASFVAFRGAQVVKTIDDLNFCLPAARLEHPGLIEANGNVTQVSGMATRLMLEADATLTFHTEGFDITLDGEAYDGGSVTLSTGEHMVLAFINDPTGHQKEKTLRIVDPPEGLALINPLKTDAENPWCWIPFPEYSHADDDLRRATHGHKEALQTKLEGYAEAVETLTGTVHDLKTFQTELGDRARMMPYDEMFVEDTHWHFTERQVIGDADGLIENASGLMYDNGESTILRPSPDGDIELVYDLGEQNVGYYDFELTAQPGVALECYGVEYIAPDGRIQHTRGNRNGMRYITREGVNQFTSTKRRSGRYLFITLRDQTEPVRIQLFRLIGSTYPVNRIGSFHSSDAKLNAIWEISARTLELCMEDTFTDCPLYEQTLWVGDARNESAFAYPVFGATDIGRRCIRLAGASLERYPIVGCQVPSSWDILLPAWSFLWGISVWDYYEYTGDRAFLMEVWPWIIENLEGTEARLDSEWGLFAGPYWNMFDWSGIDDEHELVLHNSMLLVGALNAALKGAKVIGDDESQSWLREFRQQLVTNLNALWDEEKQAYPDSIHADGTVSPSTSQHTSFLALLYGIVEPEHTDAALENVLNPPEGMVQVGSPFAIMYYYEALEAMGEFDAILNSIYEAYVPMIEAGATTVWEVFPTSGDRPSGFPTRSHCHAWSSAPVIYLNRILLGVRPTAPGGREYEISPRPYGLSWAQGTIATAKGPLEVAWEIDGETLSVEVKAPMGLNIQASENEATRPFDLRVRVINQVRS